MKLSDRISEFFSLLGSSVKSVVKVALSSRHSNISVSPAALKGEPMIIMGNGPSLRDVITDHSDALARSVTMAVNFAANAEEFTRLKPDYYLLADPHFFEGKESDPNVTRLWNRLDAVTEWEMTLYLPTGHTKKTCGLSNPRIKVENFNFTGAEGFKWLEKWLYSRGLAMPRPRNVLVPALMTAIAAGFKTIYLIGADHGWLTTLSVTDDNEVVSIQPHFYSDNSEEKKRVASVYRGVRLHDVLLSMHLAFKSYHKVAEHASCNSRIIYNATPGSFIDAFPRHHLPF